VKALFLCLSLALHAQAPLPAHPEQAAVIHLDFTQVRTLAALSRPLKASGSLVLAGDKGVIWALKRPVEITYVMGPRGLLVLDGQGRRERKGPRDAPMAAQVGQLFQALAQGDWHALGSFFTVTRTGRPEAWQVDLLPKAQAASFVKRVRLDGGRFIDRIRIEEASGDRTELVFAHQTASAPLTGAEAALLSE